MNFYREPKNFYEVLIPLFYFFKVFGLTPITFDEGDNKRLDIVSTFGDKIYSVLLILGHALAIYESNVLIGNFEFPSDNYFIRISWLFLFNYVIFSKLVGVWYCILKRQHFIDFLKTINEFDENVMNFRHFYNPSFISIFSVDSNKWAFKFPKREDDAFQNIIGDRDFASTVVWTKLCIYLPVISIIRVQNSSYLEFSIFHLRMARIFICSASHTGLCRIKISIWSAE
jgi:hypothetical protein